MSTTVSLQDLQRRQNFEAANARVSAAVMEALSSPENIVRFLGRYIDWNGWFGSGVATLSAEISRSREIFMDPAESLQPCADRSVHVASHFFDAARDEFDDSATTHRDTHRTLAQATIKGLINFQGLADQANELLGIPVWLSDINQRVLHGYGHRSPEDRHHLFRAMGFHLGSEILADEEFTIIDQSLRTHCPVLVQHLLTQRVVVAGEAHPPYYWIAIHSSVGGGVEMDHFAWAVSGVEVALQFTPPAARASARESVLQGFDAFAKVHQDFFSKVNG